MRSTRRLTARSTICWLPPARPGTLLGCGDYLRSLDRPTNVVAVDAVGSALFGGEPSARRLPGLGAGIETAHSKWAEFDQLIRVSELECVVGCRRLVEREAFFCGASAGGVAFALGAIARQFTAREPRARSIFPDGGAGLPRTRCTTTSGSSVRWDAGPAELASLVQLESSHTSPARPPDRRRCESRSPDSAPRACMPSSDCSTTPAISTPRPVSRSTSSSRIPCPAPGRSMTRVSRSTC